MDKERLGFVRQTARRETQQQGRLVLEGNILQQQQVGDRTWIQCCLDVQNVGLRVRTRTRTRSIHR